MAVNSFLFWIVYPFLFLFYWVIPSSSVKMRKWYLIVVSYLMYMSFYMRYAIILLFVTGITFLAGNCLDKATKRRKAIHVFFLIIALSPLFLFKYLGFFVDTVCQIIGWWGFELQPAGLRWMIPIGLSFFSIQAIGYQIDVYLQRIKAEKSFSDYTLFISFFPHIVAGPISKASELLPQIKAKRLFDEGACQRGFKQILWGLFLKLVIADRANLIVSYVFDNYTFCNGGDCLLAAILYSIQIYADFAGYSLMAIGIANTLGYQIINNFNRPYFSLSVTDFWHRWHISLSRWLKDYIYIPLGGSRCKKSRNYLNIIITFLVSGVWHGANWTFIIWGLIHGISQVIEKAMGWQKVVSKNALYKAWRIFVTFIIITFAWIIFRMPTLEDGIGVIVRIFTAFGAPMKVIVETDFLYLLLGLPFLVVYDIWREFQPSRLSFLNSSKVKWVVCVVLSLVILSIGMFDSGKFIYENF